MKNVTFDFFSEHSKGMYDKKWWPTALISYVKFLKIPSIFPSKITENCIFVLLGNNAWEDYFDVDRRYLMVIFVCYGQSTLFCHELARESVKRCFLSTYIKIKAKNQDLRSSSSGRESYTYRRQLQSNTNFWWRKKFVLRDGPHCVWSANNSFSLSTKCLPSNFLQ